MRNTLIMIKFIKECEVYWRKIFQLFSKDLTEKIAKSKELIKLYEMH